MGILRSLQLFRSLDTATIEYLCQQTKAEILAMGERIVSAGERIRAFYILPSTSAIVFLVIKEFLYLYFCRKRLKGFYN